MSSRSVLTSASNNISFNNPSFSRTSGAGGTGATGEISDGRIQMFMIKHSSHGGAAHLAITPEHIKVMRQYSSGKSFYWRGGGACGVMYWEIEGGERILISNLSHDGSDCGSINPDWLWRISGNGTKTVYLHSGWGSCTNPGSGVGFVTGAQSVPLFKTITEGKMTIEKYKTSYMNQTCDTFTMKRPCPAAQKYWVGSW